MTIRQHTKILATLGPACSDPLMMRALIRAGADGFRINMGHNRAADLAGLVQSVRTAALAESKPVAAVVDLGGPKIRVGELPGKQMELKEGAEVVVGRDIPLTHPDVLADVRAGHRVLLDDGKLELTVVGPTAGGVRMTVKTGGLLLQGKGVNLPDSDLRMPALTDKDRDDLAAAVQAQADYVSLSFVQRPEDIIMTRAEATKLGRCPLIIAKIEKPSAVDRFEDILKTSDGIMVARGDLGVELSPAKVPVLQKRIIALTNAAGKTVITATQMLESMISNPRPTRAEASDVANAVWDGTDAVMLSGETAVGKYPLETVTMMRDIIAEAELAVAPKRMPFAAGTRIHALASAAVNAAEELKVRAIVALTVSGYTAQMVAQLRPTVPLIAAVPDEHARDSLALVWGVIPLVVPWSKNSDEFMLRLEKALVDGGFVKAGDTVVLVSGSMRLRGVDYIMKIYDIGK